MAPRRMHGKNKKASDEEERDCENQEGEEKDRAEDQHPAGHLGIRAENQGDRAQEDDASPPTRT
jgi:hypothetical protein